MLWNNENKTVQFFIANFKINKNYQQEDAKINLEFRKECKQDFNSYKNSGHHLMILSVDKKFRINENTLFLWDNHTISMYDFKTGFSESDRKNLKFKISENEKFSFI